VDDYEEWTWETDDDHWALWATETCWSDWAAWSQSGDEWVCETCYYGEGDNYWCYGDDYEYAEWSWETDDGE